MAADLIPSLRSHRIWEEGSQAWWGVEGWDRVSSRRLGLYAGGRVNCRFLQSAPGTPSRESHQKTLMQQSPRAEIHSPQCLWRQGPWEPSPLQAPGRPRQVVPSGNSELSWVGRGGLETALGLLCKALRANFLESADSSNSPSFLRCFVFSDYCLP